MIADELDRWSVERPETPVVVQAGRAWTYGQVTRAGRQAAEQLAHLAGLCVAVSLEDLALELAVLSALDRLGATVCLNVPHGAAGVALDCQATIATDSEPALLVRKLLELGDLSPASGEHATGRPAVSPESRIVLFTSGTSGPPKPAVHTWRSLSAAVSRASKYTGRRWLLAYDVHRFAGLQVLLQAICTGGAVVLPASRDPAAVADCLVRDRVEMASGTPTFWRMLLASCPRERLSRAPLQQITLGGEPAGQPILDALRETFPQASIYHIYASTEMGTCFTVRDGLAGFPLSLLSDTSLPCQLRIADDGELLIRSNRAMLGYLDQADTEPVPAAAWFASGDLVSVVGDRVLFVGRRSEGINVGGNKVFPSEVEDVIRAVQGVQDTHVYALPSSVVGQLVAANVVMEPGLEPAQVRRAILALCRERLQKHKIPAQIEFVDRLDVTDAGKLSRANR